jgi:Tol biopolymer transport system component
MDRIRDRVRRVSESPLGLAAHGSSTSPYISLDGRWITFWSTARNLVHEEEGLNERSTNRPPLWDLFIYDRINRQTERIEIGRKSLQDGVLDLDPVPISADGEWLAITLQPDDQIANSLAIANKQDVYLYDHHNQLFVLVNRSKVLTAGNGPSNSPAISSDGRYVAFTSLASDLVNGDSYGGGDDNEKADVFRYDHWTGTIERASIASDGTQGNDHSGSSSDQNIWGRKLGISMNGQYIIFTSMADNLALAKETARHPAGFVLLVYLRLKIRN